ncbi:ABC transporter permease [Nesterenkonia alba]|uniref:ABC transporter permease n=1 Tax=Nesterenkonia alba TaxID=515814 RepID=UPI0004212BF2|nr:ABC transporter permease [Nesterenkonia alba]
MTDPTQTHHAETTAGPSPAADKDLLAARAGARGVLFQAERTLRSMRAYGGVILASSIFQPIMYILAMGLGLGVLVGQETDFSAYGADSYLVYIAPAILASTVAMSAGIEFTFPVMEGFKWRKLYYGAQATALTPGQIAAGHILAVCCRFLVHSLVFIGVLFAFGVATSPLALLQVFTAAAGGLAIGLPIMAYVASLRDERGHAALIQRFVVMPMFLFSGTFYPLENLPGPLQIIGWVSPIYHGNELGRVLAFGQPTAGWLVAVHVLYLLCIITVAWFAVRRVFIRRLGYEEWRGRIPGKRADARREARLAAKDAARQAARTADKPTPAPQPRTGFAANMYSGNIRAVFQRGLAAIRNNRGILFVSGFLEPVLFLTSFGLGISPMISGVEAADGGTVSYAAFIAPALLAVAMMNGAIFDSMWNVFFKLKITKLYKSMMATSLGPLDISIGEIGLALFRGTMYAFGFLAVVLIAGLADPLNAVLMWVAAMFISLGFASVGMAVTTFMSRFQQMDWTMMVLMPMFLFSATLFPIDVYPAGVQALIQALPLWHGVELMRDIAFWDFSALTLVHIGYYTVMIAVGLSLATYRMKKLFLR